VQPLLGRNHARGAVVAEDLAVARFATVVAPAADPTRALASVPQMRISVGALPDPAFFFGQDPPGLLTGSALF
jgi:hypothetical protein